MDNTQTIWNNRQRTRSNSESDTGILSSTLDANGMPIVDFVGVSSIPSNCYRSDTNLSQLGTVYSESPIGVGASTRFRLTIEEINQIYNNLRTDSTQLSRAVFCTNLNKVTISEMRALTERIERTKRATREALKGIGDDY